MSLLESTIDELLSREPFWKICYPCKFKGFCCKGAEIDFSKNEQHIIDEYINTLPNDSQKIIYENKKYNKHCIYHSVEKCLIHEVRPQNCRYTPFQALIDNDNTLIYTMVRIVNGLCDFKR